MLDAELSLAKSPHDLWGMSKDMKLAAWLTYAVPTERAAEVSYDLINRFQTVDRILRLSNSEIRAVPGVCEEIAEAISLFHSLHMTALREMFEDGQLSQRTKAVQDYCRMEFQSATTAVFKVFYSRDDRLIHEGEIIKGQLNSVCLYPREIVKEALIMDANSIYIVFGRSSGHDQMNKYEIASADAVRNACMHLEIKFAGADVVIT